MLTIDTTNMCSHLQRKLFEEDGIYNHLWIAMQDDPELTAVVRSRQLHIYRNGKKVLNLLTDICRQILPQKEADGIGNLVTMNCLEDGDKFEAGGFPLHASTSIPRKSASSDLPPNCQMGGICVVWATSRSVLNAVNMPRVPTG